MGFYATVGNALEGRLNANVLSTEQVDDRRSASSLCSVGKLLSITGLIASVAAGIFAILIIESTLVMSLTLAGACIVGIVCYEALVVSKRMQDALDGVAKDIQGGRLANSYAKAAYITQGTIFARSFAQLALRNHK